MPSGIEFAQPNFAIKEIAPIFFVPYTQCDSYFFTISFQFSGILTKLFKILKQVRAVNTKLTTT